MIKLYSRSTFIVFLLILSGHQLIAQTVLKGVVADRTNGETLVGATVLIKGTTEGSITDIDGSFEFSTTASFPLTLTVSYIGYVDADFAVESASQKLRFKLATQDFELAAFEKTAERISDKEKEEPLTIESSPIR